MSLIGSALNEIVGMYSPSKQLAEAKAMQDAAIRQWFNQTNEKVARLRCRSIRYKNGHPVVERYMSQLGALVVRD